MDYDRVDQELARGTAPELLCATCPWDRLCIAPPAMSRQEIDQQLAAAQKKDDARNPGGTGMPMETLLTAAIYGGRDQMATLCPVFALRLRGPDGRGVADAVRTLMRGEVG